MGCLLQIFWEELVGSPHWLLLAAGRYCWSGSKGSILEEWPIRPLTACGQGEQIPAQWARAAVRPIPCSSKQCHFCPILWIIEWGHLCTFSWCVVGLGGKCRRSHHSHLLDGEAEASIGSPGHTASSYSRSEAGALFWDLESGVQVSSLRCHH